jgi:ADP-ribose pyrophosphatase
MFFARGLTFGERHLDDDEFLECEKVTLDRMLEMIEEGLLPDAKTQITALRVKKLLNDEKN